MLGHPSLLFRARHAAEIMRDLVNVVHEVNEWRHERDAFVAKYIDESNRRSRGRLRTVSARPS